MLRCATAELHAREEFFGAHVGEKLPEGLVLGFGVEVPHGVDYCCCGEVDHTLLRTYPP
jgi:hypothetical protein